MQHKQGKFSRGTLAAAAQILGVPPSTAKYRFLVGDKKAVETFEAVEKIRKQAELETQAKLQKLAS